MFKLKAVIKKKLNDSLRINLIPFKAHQRKLMSCVNVFRFPGLLSHAPVLALSPHFGRQAGGGWPDTKVEFPRASA